MEEKILRRLEYHKVLDRLAQFTVSPLGKERALKLLPVTDIELIRQWQSETTEGRELLRLDPAAQIGGWYDVREQVMKAQRGVVLDPEDLLAVGGTVSSIRRVKKFFGERPDRYPLLRIISETMGIFRDLEQKIFSSITPGGEIADTASSSLGQIRRHLASSQAQVKTRLEGYVRSATYQKYLQDPIVTIRDNRYVIPVKQEYRSQVPGIIHDQSASGATLFVEPMAVLEANNDVRRFQAAEKQEILRILFDLSAGVSAVSSELLASLKVLGRLDLIMARARYSLNLEAWEPIIKNEPILDIKRGRHPLLEGEVVPVTLNLGLDFDALVITGPNTGGKTVALKTVGLLVLMAQSGMHVPAGDGTVLGIFNQLFADIGDEQSIEQSLSTFSSHMTNIVDILCKAGADSLVLLDELGAGTDPTEGAALAQAILERLHHAGVKIIATTHYSEIKNFALVNPRVENASVEFDAVTLCPTYRLIIGRPGRSNAFEIAAKLGMEPALVQRSREFMSSDQRKAAELMDHLERTSQQALQEREEASYLIEEARSLKESYQRMNVQLAEKHDVILAKAREDAGNALRKARRESEEMIRDLREKLSSGVAREREAAIRTARERLSGLEEKVSPAAYSPLHSTTDEVPNIVRPGDDVFIPRFKQKGYVVGNPKDGHVQVQVGVVKITVPLTDLRRAESTPGGGVQMAGIMSSKARDISTRLDLRGMTSDEALMEMEKYIDDASLAGLAKVYIIHGKGTGALRTAVQRQLKSLNRVKSFRLGETGEGGMGCTVVELLQ